MVEKENILLTKTLLTTGQNFTIGWLRNSSLTLGNRSNIMEELKARFSTDIPFQVVSRIITNKGEKITTTKALGIECAVADAHELEEAIMDNYYDSSATWRYGVTYNMQYVPIKPSGPVTDDIITESMYEQNRSLKHVRHIVLYNVQDIDLPLEFEDEEGK